MGELKMELSHNDGRRFAIPGESPLANIGDASATSLE